MSGEMPAARPTDPTAHGVPAAPGTGAPTVIVDGLPIWRTMLDTHLCPAPPPPPHGPEKIYMGSTTVLINNQMACRMGDILQGLGPPNPVMMGSPTVLIGDVGFGMGTERLKANFVGAASQLLEQWDALTPDERLARIEAALNRMRPLGMTAIEVREIRTLDPEVYGQFDFRSWSVDLNSDVLNGDMDSDRMAELANTAFHEGRHGEQWWNAAQYLAGIGTPASQIKSIMEIPTDVANDAARHPVLSGTSEGAMGEIVTTSVYGSRGGYRNSILSALDDPGVYPQYRALPEEEDAWRHGDDVEHAMRAMMRRTSEN